MSKKRRDEVYNISIVSRTDARKKPVSYVMKKKTIVGLITTGGIVFILVLLTAVTALMYSVDASGRIDVLKQAAGQGKLIVAMASPVPMGTSAPLEKPIPTPSIPTLIEQSIADNQPIPVDDDSGDIYVDQYPEPSPTADPQIVRSSKDPAFISAAKINGVKREGDILINGKIELVNWFKGGSELYKKGARAIVIDLMSGKHFNVYRFGGWYHGDSEPLTKEDVAIFKDIYSGKWSWDRRPIILKIGERYIAASMNGMPHNGNPNAQNGMGGHFCIHLFHSRVHETGREEARHQNCVMEAFRYGNLAITEYDKEMTPQYNAATSTPEKETKYFPAGESIHPLPEDEEEN